MEHHFCAVKLCYFMLSVALFLLLFVSIVLRCFFCSILTIYSTKVCIGHDDIFVSLILLSPALARVGELRVASRNGKKSINRGIGKSQKKVKKKKKRKKRESKENAK